PMTPQQIESVLQAFGRVLELHPSGGSEELLPYPRPLIEKAFRDALLLDQDDEGIRTIEGAHLLLPTFVPDPYATIAMGNIRREEEAMKGYEQRGEEGSPERAVWLNRFAEKMFVGINQPHLPAIEKALGDVTACGMQVVLAEHKLLALLRKTSR